MSKRILKIDEDDNVRDEGGDVIAQFMWHRDALAFVHAQEVLTALKRSYMVLSQEKLNEYTKDVMVNEINVTIARAEGKCP